MTLLEDNYFQEKLEQYQTPFTVYNFNTMYTGTFTYMPADKTWVYDPKTNSFHNFHNCPVHNQFEVNLLSWILSVSFYDAIDTFNATLLDFGYTQQLQRYDPETHHVHPPSKHPFWPTN